MRKEISYTEQEFIHIDAELNSILTQLDDLRFKRIKNPKERYKALHNQTSQLIKYIHTGESHTILTNDGCGTTIHKIPM